MAKRVPIVAFHRLVPFAVLGFAINATSGSMFLITEPDQYLYNRAFHFKLLFIALAGLNVLVFYLAVFRRVSGLTPGVDAPHGREGVWGDLVDLLDSRHCLRASDYLVSA